MKKITLLIALAIYSSHSCADDIRPRWELQDQQLHAASGCIISLFVRESAKELGSHHPALWGAGIGAAAAFTRTLKTEEKKQDAMANIIGALVCVSLAEGIELAISRQGAKVNLGF